MKASSSKIAQTNSNTGHKNIVYRDKFDDYSLQITRDGNRLTIRFSTLEKAIIYRDRAFSFYSQFGRLPTRDELNVRTRERRMTDPSKLGSCISFDSVSTNRPYRVEIRRDNLIFLQNLETLEEAVNRRDEILKFYNEQGRMPSREEQELIFGVRFNVRNKYNKSSNSRRSNVGYRNISFNDTTKLYLVKIRRNSQIISICVDTLENALDVRDKILKFYDEYHRLPTNLDNLNH